MPSHHWKQAISTTLAIFIAASGPMVHLAMGQSVFSVPAGLRGVTASDSEPAQHLPFAHFTIPFDVDRNGPPPREVHLWVSPDAGKSWLKYASAAPEKRVFEFHAAAEGDYMFAVQTSDSKGESALAASKPMRIVVDTTKPKLQLAADISPAGRLIIDYQISDSFLIEDTIRLSFRTDSQPDWEPIRIGLLERTAAGLVGRSEIEMPRGRDLELRLVASDQAQNSGEAVSRFSMPRTASAATGMQLASGRGDRKLGEQPVSPNKIIVPSASDPKTRKLTPSDGATAWTPPTIQTQKRSPQASLTAESKNSIRVANLPDIQLEEVPSPQPEQSGSRLTQSPSATESPSNPSLTIEPTRQVEPALQAGPSMQVGPALQVDPAPQAEPAQRATDASLQEPATEKPTTEIVQPTGQTSERPDEFHTRSRSFSLDYSIEALRGVTVSDIELWGTEDRGTTWQKWGNDADRSSPFDVQVGNDGLFGFRMVIIGANGVVNNRPHDGDAADMWIVVDTQIPTIKITRALYGEGAEAGMLVIDYVAQDDNLHDRPISLSFSERTSGPWVTIAAGLRNSGLYLWKAAPSLPQHVFLRAQAVDKAGNVQEHRLELPINLRGMTPRGRIQGVRPIDPM